MADIVTEEFSQNLYCDPSGQRKTMPTIFDELRWAMQHSQKPLEQTLQLISEFHGLYTGMSKELMELVNNIETGESAVKDKQYRKAAQSALDALANVQNITSQVGRQNNITASQMSVPLLREFVSRCQALHPSINIYIQMNIGKYPYFQQISESVCQHGQIVLSKWEIPPIDRLDVNGADSMTTDSPLRRITGNKLFKSCYSLVDNANSFANCLFLRAMPMENNISLLMQDYGKSGSAIAHGHNYCMDGFNADRGKAAVQPCISKAAGKFGATLQLVDNFFPVDYQIENTPQFFNLVAEGEPYMADKLNRPLTRQVEIPIAEEVNKTQIA